MDPKTNTMAKDESTMTPEEKAIQKQWGKLFSEYLIDCCMLYELACPRRSKDDFDRMAKDLYDHWDGFVHYHKALVDKNKLVPNTWGQDAVFPSILRNISCHIAKRFPNNPMTDASEVFIAEYVSMRIAMDGEEPDY